MQNLSAERAFYRDLFASNPENEHIAGGYDEIHALAMPKVPMGLVLDVGCGTGTLTLLIKKAHPEAEVIGIDGDRKILEIAKKKVGKAGLDVTLDYGMAFDLPYPDGSFDRVFSSLLFHHLTRENKVGTLKEIFRVLRPGGELHVADLGKPHNWIMSVAFLSVRMLDGFKTTADNINGLLPVLFGYAGFEDIQQSRRYMTMSGTLGLYKAVKPG